MVNKYILKFLVNVKWVKINGILATAEMDRIHINISRTTGEKTLITSLQLRVQF